MKRGASWTMAKPRRHATETARDARMGARRGRAFIARARVVVVVLDPARGDIARDCIVVVVIARIVARVVRERASRVAE